MAYHFERALPIWGENLTNEYNQILGFRTDLVVREQTSLRIGLAARTFYRLYINGKMVANGPARTAAGYCRVDEHTFSGSGRIAVAIEVIAQDKPRKYSNDNTMEPGLLTAEISARRDDGRWDVLAATGTEEGGFLYRELSERRSMAELMSHSRGIVEYYWMNPHSNDWKKEERCGGTKWKRPVILIDVPYYMDRRAPYPTYREIPMHSLESVRSMAACEPIDGGIVFRLAKMFNESWYELLREEDCFLEQLLAEKEVRFSGRYERICYREQGTGIRLEAGSGATAFVFSIPKSEVGFLRLGVETEKGAVVDLINSDHLDRRGTVKANTYAARYVLEPGRYELTTFEPRLTKYVKLIVRTQGAIVLTDPLMIDYSYPESDKCQFSCSDGELNAIYEGARRTLRLNTLDIFMDCPQRERGGWLCDSQFTSWAAWQLFGDLRVEKDFLENFMLTHAEGYNDAFFPEVYPGAKSDKGDPGIQSWSFWLLTQLWDYYHRSGDREFVEACRTRVEKFVDAMECHIGESRLFEGFDCLFVDWSLSNEKFSLYPISLPVNCLIVCAIERMAELYDVKRWRELAARVRTRIESIRPEWGLVSDGYTWRDGRLEANGCLTESGIALQLWSGFHTEEEVYTVPFVETMGTCPTGRPNPNIGRANLFIGLMIRFDVLGRMGRINTLVRELKDVYLPQLSQGSGTFFENINAHSGCHGFNGMAGALLVNHVLGLGQPMQLTKTVRISPHPGTLLWARGRAWCEDGEITMAWTADGERHVLEMEVTLPEGWQFKIERPFELSGWKILVNDKKI
ncbi:MAG: hypothetical protein Q4C60_00815 [Eubacteriales bacterium]|nr:hypothetical protein [Eubacteriales bacterium]